MKWTWTIATLLPALLCFRAPAAELGPLSVGVAGHAFDHLGGIADQAPAAAAAGANIIYPSGVGALGYEGLPSPEKLRDAATSAGAYVRSAKKDGIQLAIGYVCATSIVKLDNFDRNWTPEFRAQFKTPPASWLQKDKDGTPLPSWYGGDYRPACMNNPDWRAYEKAIVRLQLDAGQDGIFFDNPTVHPDGCYCEHCMTKFAQHIGEKEADVAALRKIAVSRPKDFMRFRCTVASDFLSEIRAYARTINFNALITCNNSLNAPDAFYSQCRTFGYSIHDMSAVEDLVVVEDMATQPRVLPDGTTVEYGPVYEMLHAISRGKPVVAVTLADGDYHTPTNLIRLAMAEAVAHGASYLSWPTWPVGVRQKMIESVRPQAVFLRKNAALHNGAARRADVLVFLPMRRYIETPDCQTLAVVRDLAKANVQFRVVCEDNLAGQLASNAPSALIVESNDLLTDDERAALDRYRSAGGRVVLSGQANWQTELSKSRSVELEGPATLRAVVCDQPGRTIVHLLNLNVQKLSSFEDHVTPANDVKIRVRTPGDAPKSVSALTADVAATQGTLDFTTGNDGVVNLTIPRVVVSTILVFEK